ncbi:hypothetical protein IG631_22565 [Alternaria alternata]|nr:hypothetical protein IG631_22565 [Alternaria alternata]
MAMRVRSAGQTRNLRKSLSTTFSAGQSRSFNAAIVIQCYQKRLLHSGSNDISRNGSLRGQCDHSRSPINPRYTVHVGSSTRSVHIQCSARIFHGPCTKRQRILGILTSRSLKSPHTTLQTTIPSQRTQ